MLNNNSNCDANKINIITRTCLTKYLNTELKFKL